MPATGGDSVRGGEAATRLLLTERRSRRNFAGGGGHDVVSAERLSEGISVSYVNGMMAVSGRSAGCWFSGDVRGGRGNPGARSTEPAFPGIELRGGGGDDQAYLAGARGTASFDGGPGTTRSLMPASTAPSSASTSPAAREPTTSSTRRA